MTDEQTPQGEVALVLAAARGVAEARGWTPEAIEQGELRGTLPYDEARAALSAIREAEPARVDALSVEECSTLLAALAAWDLWPNASRPGPQRVRVLEAALEEARKVDALFEKVEAWYADARQRHTAEVEPSSG